MNKDERLEGWRKKKKTPSSFWPLKLEAWNYERGAARASAAQFFAALKRADDNIITESSHNTWLNKQCTSFPPKVSAVFCFSTHVFSLNSRAACVHARGKGKEVKPCAHANSAAARRGYLRADKSEMDSSLMYLCSNWLKLKQDEKGLHFRVAALLLMTRGPPTAISAYYNLEMARLCF